jgi:phenylacetate-CoA ligase
VKAYVGVTVQVRVVETGALDRSDGKAKRIVDMRPR